MKRFIAAVTFFVMVLAGASEVSAQKYGIVGGATFSSMQSIEKSSKTGFNAGVTAQFRLPLGFSVQPSLIYNSKCAQAGGQLVNTSLNVGYLELPVSVQWGPDLLVFRPFVEVTPFVGYALGSKFSAEALLTSKEWKTSYLNRLEYGLGLGGGVEVWRFQVTCRYNWNFGPLFSDQGEFDIISPEEAFGNRNFGGVTLSLAFMFGK